MHHQGKSSALDSYGVCKGMIMMAMRGSRVQQRAKTKNPRVDHAAETLNRKP